MNLAKIVISFFACASALAVDAINPDSLCSDRYITEDEQKTCLEKIKKIDPDWYIAYQCKDEYEEEKFYSCLNIKPNAQYNPNSIDNCTKNKQGNEVPTECLKRLPASIKSK